MRNVIRAIVTIVIFMMGFFLCLDAQNPTDTTSSRSSTTARTFPRNLNRDNWGWLGLIGLLGLAGLGKQKSHQKRVQLRDDSR